MGESAEALETIELLYQAAVDPALWPEALHRFALATGGAVIQAASARRGTISARRGTISARRGAPTTRAAAA